MPPRGCYVLPYAYSYFAQLRIGTRTARALIGSDHLPSTIPLTLSSLSHYNLAVTTLYRHIC